MGFFLDVLRLKYSFFIGNCEIVAKNIFAVFAPRIAKMKKKLENSRFSSVRLK